MKTWLRVLLWVAAALFAFSTVTAITFRRRDPATMRRIARWNRENLNPRMLRVAGKRHWYAASLHHTGRTSGRQFETPVVTHHTDGTCIIPLPYGRSVDWLQNLETAGSGTLIDHGESYAVSEPRIVPQGVAFEKLRSNERLRYRWYGVSEFVELQLDPIKPTMAATG